MDEPPEKDCMTQKIRSNRMLTLTNECIKMLKQKLSQTRRAHAGKSVKKAVEITALQINNMNYSLALRYIHKNANCDK